MNKRQLDHQALLRKIHMTVQSYEASWKDYPEYVQIMQELENYYNQSEELIQEKKDLSLPYSGYKQDEWETFGRRIAQLAGFLHRLATQEGDKDTAMRTNFTSKSLLRGRVHTSLLTSEMVLRLAQQRVEELKTMGLGEEILQSAQSQYDSFTVNSTLPSDRRRQRTVVNASLENLQLESKSFLKKELDMMMRVFEDRDPEFFLAYHESRKAVNKAATLSSTEPEEGDGGDEDDPIEGSKLVEFNSATEPDPENFIAPEDGGDDDADIPDEEAA